MADSISRSPRRVLLLGAGKIGRMIAKLLAGTGDYIVTVADREPSLLERVRRVAPGTTATEVDVEDRHALHAVVRGQSAVLSALPFFRNAGVAEAALRAGASYFDLTEDMSTSATVRGLASEAVEGQVFMPQCGLAPGFVSVAGFELTRHFDRLDSLHMRVGALPQFPSNALKYNLTWSTDGLINEYCNACDAIVEGTRREVLPLEGLEHLSIDGVRYEAFNTSGGLGTLCETLDGRVRSLDYKTIRYLGHRDLAAFLIEDLRLRERRSVLKDILEHAVPVTFQDVVIIFCTATGQRRGQLVEVTDARKIYSRSIDGENWSAIQITTAAGLLAAVDLHFGGRLPGRGFVRQEQMSLSDFLENRFGRLYASGAATPLVLGDIEQEEKP